MKKFRRAISVVLLLCITMSLLLPVQTTQAAQVVQRYELDTDGIDVGATYLIVNTSNAGTGNALRFYYSGYTRDLKNQTLTIRTDEEGKRYIDTGFTSEADCQFQFTSATSGRITHGSYYVNVNSARYENSATNSTSLTFSNQGSGQYRISYRSGNTNYYLRYSNSDWIRGGRNTVYSVYLFKLVEYEVGFDVTFDGNGYTSGSLPQGATMLDSGADFIIPENTDAPRKDIGEDTWLFLCWNTRPDGSGTEYHPGDKIVVTEDIVLYADWYQQTKYTVSMITSLDGVRTDVEDISGQNKTFYIQRNGIGDYIPLTRTAEGTYSVKVTENDNYIVFSRLGEDGEYEPVHGHKVTIYNQDGATECQHFSVTYNTQGGLWAQGEDPGKQIYHANDNVAITGNTPTLAGNRFLGWVDQDGNPYNPGEQILGINETTILTARWEKTVSVSVNVVIDHAPITGGMDSSENTDVTFTVMRTDENGYNRPVGTVTLTEENLGNYTFYHDTSVHESFYTLKEGAVTFADLQKGTYTASASKSNYEVYITSETDSEGNVTIQIRLQFVPNSFDLDFDVEVADWENVPENLRPEAVNIKVTSWYNRDGVVGWHIISQQEGANPPTTVAIDPATGKGHGFYPVWKEWADDSQEPYFYRILVSSYVMPDGSVVAAQEDNYTIYTAGIYSGTVTIRPETSAPAYPTPGATDLLGTRYDAATDSQDSTPTLTITVTPYTVTFDAGMGELDGEKLQQLQEQFRYPDLNNYTPVYVPANDEVMFFLGWYDENGDLADNQAGQLLTKDVTYYARYGSGATISGQVQLSTTYQQDGETVNIHDIDLPEEVMVLVRKQVGELFVTVDSQLVKLDYEQDPAFGLGQYEFTGLPNDGTVYQIHALPVNYTDSYDNDPQDGNFSKEEEIAIIDADTLTGSVNIRLDFVPEVYMQGIVLDTTQIEVGFRPTGALMEVLYRDLGDAHAYQVISQHTVPPYGVSMQVDSLGQATGAEEVWIRHVDGTYYEYQAELSKLYGSVAGAYTPEGIEYTADSPYTVEYGAPKSHLSQTESEGYLVATLVPKQYTITLDLNLGGDTAPVRGMDEFMVDDGSGENKYAYVHTWSYASSFIAYPYREGYVFDGWLDEEGNNVMGKDGSVPVGATLSRNTTLTAKWTELKGTDYAVRHLELNTNKVLHGAQVVTGVAEGSRVDAATAHIAIDGYIYAGALIDGTFVHKDENPELVITNDPKLNQMVIYYLPDVSSGYTEQIESNVVIDKTAALEDNGTYSITMTTYTKDSPITTMIRQDTPLDIVLVLDQSGSMYTAGALDDLQDAVTNFISLIAEHGRENETDHRISIVGYASDEYGGYTRPSYPTAGKDGSKWYNTGVFDSHGVFHPYSVTGFNYTEFNGAVSPDGTYYTYAHGEYLLLTYHEEYRHLITEAEARQANIQGEQVYGYVDGLFVELTRNTSGLWLYGDKKLYSETEFFTLHTDVWTHREGLEPREIHAYGIGDSYKVVGEHSGIYTRTETKDADPMQSIYTDALVPVTVGANGSGSITPGLTKATQTLGANGRTYVSYGMEMANSIFEANPLETGDGRQRVIVVFTDGKPGDGSNFDMDEANKALELAKIASTDHKALIYTIGMYGNDVVAAESDQDYFMNGLSSNYPNATTMDDVWQGVTYQVAESNYRLDTAGPYFVQVDGQAYPLTLQSKYQNKEYYNCWGYTDNSGNRVTISETKVAEGHPLIANGMVGGYTIYRKYGDGYKTTNKTGYYTVAQGSQELKQYFANVMKDITTNISTEIVLHSDTILRDIMGQGLVLVPGAVVTAYKQKGTLENGTVTWLKTPNGEDALEYVASVQIPHDPKDSVTSTETTTITYQLEDGTQVVKNNVPFINVYNLNSPNATNPMGADYQPHAVDVTGYDFDQWYIDETNPEGYRMVVTITGIEATDDVQWGRSTATNHARSGLWLPADAAGNRQILLAFDQPTTIFVERAYVLDYGKEFTLSSWYFDDEDGKFATPIHVDCDTSDGMNGFDTPNTANSVNGEYGNTKYGNVQLKDGKVTYYPTSMNWGGHEEFYVFGQTWRKTVLAQEANNNGIPENEELANLWNKVTVIPANNIYYEDSFITTESTTGQNGINGFVFTGAWSTEGTDANNEEVPEHLESAPYGDVHGWTDSLVDDIHFTDGTTHVTGMNEEVGASVDLTFTGTGVEVYTRTNSLSGMVIAVLYSVSTDENGQPVTTQYKALAMDNLAVSGDYFHIPTVAFKDLPYGTYSLKLIATAATTDGLTRYEYYVDGVRIHNPLGVTTNYENSTVKDAYGLETNAVFTEVRDILLDNGSFNADQPQIGGAVFIDQLKEGQGTEDDGDGIGIFTYEIGTFEDYGPKNEVYLSAGQAIVLKVEEGNTYYVGLKSLKGSKIKARVSGVDTGNTYTEIEIKHTTDLYYKINPIDGYIVIQNNNRDASILSITNLRTTNPNAPAPNGGVQLVSAEEALTLMQTFSEQFLAAENEPIPDEPEEEERIPEQPQTENTLAFANMLFTAVRQWLDNEEAEEART